MSHYKSLGFNPAQFLLLVSLTLGLFPITASANGEYHAEDIVDVPDVPAAAYDGDAWRLSIAPYGWVSGVKGDMLVRGNNVDVDTTVHDILYEYLDDIEFIGQIDIEATRGPYTLMLNPMYLKLSTVEKMGRAKIGVKGELAIFDFGYFFRFTPIEGMPLPFSAEFLLGGRYMRTRVQLNPANLPKVSRGKYWTVPIVGLRARIPATEKIQFSLRADYGGFNIYNTKYTWSAAAIASLKIHEMINIGAGFHALGFNYSSGRGKNKFKEDLTLYGPLLGIQIVTS